MPDGPQFDAAFRRRFADLLRWRRDVRSFTENPVPDALLGELLSLAALAPSVGLSEPWRFVRVESAAMRRVARDSFSRANEAALEGYDGERAALYARLKLSGMDRAPVQLAIFADEGTAKGHGLGRGTMPETLRYSAVLAVHGLWLAARAHGLGVGWISILEPDVLTRRLDVPAGWAFVAYLCIGWPAADSETPELASEGWEARAPGPPVILRR